MATRFTVVCEDGQARAIQMLLTRPGLAADMGNRAFQVCEKNTGAVDRTLDRFCLLGLKESHV